jgi:hypothetical protein
LFCSRNAGETRAGRGGADSASERTQRNSDAEFLDVECTGKGVSRSSRSEAPATPADLTNDMKLRKGQGFVAGAASAATGAATVAVMTAAQIAPACSAVSNVEVVMQRVRYMSPEQIQTQVYT